MRRFKQSFKAWVPKCFYLRTFCSTVLVTGFNGLSFTFNGHQGHDGGVDGAAVVHGRRVADGAQLVVHHLVTEASVKLTFYDVLNFFKSMQSQSNFFHETLFDYFATH